MADLGLNTLVDAVKNLATSATGGYDKMVDFIEAFRSDNTNNPFGTAARKDVGTSQGDVLELGTGGLVAIARLPDATTTAKGIVEIATAAEVDALSDTAKMVTPGALPAATTTQVGVVALASGSEAAAGDNETKATSPNAVKQAFNARMSHLAVGSYAFLVNATATDINAGATTAGSNLRYGADPKGGVTGDWVITQTELNALSSPSGTWRAMGMKCPGKITGNRYFLGFFLRTA